MSQELGESREAWGRDVMKMAEDFANKVKDKGEPFYIVYHCKQDRRYPGAFRQTIKAYREKPAAMLGILVWYVDHSVSEFRFCPELSAPPDIPIDPNLLSDKASDASERVMEQGQKLNALVS
jgi:hypothetical protein